jgi:hypothetical protein
LIPSPLQKIIPQDVWESIQEVDERTLIQSRITNAFLQKHKLTGADLLALSWQKVEIIFANLDEDFHNKRLKLLCYATSS